MTKKNEPRPTRTTIRVTSNGYCSYMGELPESRAAVSEYQAAGFLILTAIWKAADDVKKASEICQSATHTKIEIDIDVSQ